MTISNWKHLDRRTVHVVMAGQLDGDEYREAADNIATMAGEARIGQVVIDRLRVDRDQNDEPPEALAEKAAETMHECGVERIAFVEARPDTLAKAFKSAFQRRGGELKSFEDLESASGWLGVFHTGVAPGDAARS